MQITGFIYAGPSRGKETGSFELWVYSKQVDTCTRAFCWCVHCQVKLPSLFLSLFIAILSVYCFCANVERSLCQVICFWQAVKGNEDVSNENQPILPIVSPFIRCHMSRLPETDISHWTLILSGSYKWIYGSFLLEKMSSSDVSPLVISIQETFRLTHPIIGTDSAAKRIPSDRFPHWICNWILTERTLCLHPKSRQSWLEKSKVSKYRL